MTKKLLFVVNDSRYFMKTRFRLAMAAKAAGYTVAVAVPDRWALHDLLNAGFTVFHYPLHRSTLSLQSQWKTLSALYRIYRAYQPDIVHHFALKPILLGTIAAKRLGNIAVINSFTGVGFIFTANTVFARLGRSLMQIASRFSLRKTGCHIFQNEDDRQMLISKGMVSRENSRVIQGSGIDTDFFQSTNTQQKDIPIILCPARLLWTKGIYEFIEVAKRCQGKAQFVLVGDEDRDNPAAIPLEEIETCEKAGWISWWGYQQDMRSIYDKVDIVCLPSYREGLSNVLLEAMSMEKAVITTEAPGCRQAIESGVSGELVPVKAVNELVLACEKLINDKSLRLRYGKAARERAIAYFSLDKIIKSYLDVYREQEREFMLNGSIATTLTEIDRNESAS